MTARPASALDAFRVDGRVAIVTGGGQGIGAATALALADAGADLVLTARTADDLDRVAAAVVERGRRAVTIAGDVNDLDHVARVVEAAVAELGGIDIVVSNAGGSVLRPFADNRVHHLERAFHFNVSVAFELTRLALPHLLRSGTGAVVTIGSMAGVHATRGSMAHSLSKAALAQLTRLMAADLAPRVRVNAVLPGAVETASLKGYVDDDVRAGMAARTAMRRNGTPEDIASAVLYLASPASSWVTGKLLEVDGLAPPDLVPRDQPDLQPGPLTDDGGRAPG
jgi:7-alpha-hydroxysteroid dehydrogenase